MIYITHILCHSLFETFCKRSIGRVLLLFFVMTDMPQHSNSFQIQPHHYLPSNDIIRIYGRDVNFNDIRYQKHERHYKYRWNVEQSYPIYPINILFSKKDSNEIIQINTETRIQQNPSKTKEFKINDKRDEPSFDPILILPIVTASIVTITCIITLYSQWTNHPFVEFDVDFYMALDKTLSGSNTGDQDALSADTILSLPQLSPAEQLVGALFGPK